MGVLCKYLADPNIEYIKTIYKNYIIKICIEIYTLGSQIISKHFYSTGLFREAVNLTLQEFIQTDKCCMYLHRYLFSTL